jgi:uncharacterized protein YqeY
MDMNLKSRLQQDLERAVRDRDGYRKSAIRLVRAALQNEEIARQHELGDPEVLDVIGHEIKQHQESLVEFEKANRVDLVTEEKAILEALSKYLPPQLSREEIALAAREAIAETRSQGPQHVGQVMRILMPRLRGKADGGTVNQVVRDLLSAGGQN